jgi:hypothetical protein
MTPEEQAARDRHPAGTGLWSEADTEAAWAALDADTLAESLAADVDIIAIVDLTEYMAGVRAAQRLARTAPLPSRAPTGIVAGVALMALAAGAVLALTHPALSGATIAGGLLIATGGAVLARLTWLTRRNNS